MSNYINNCKSDEYIYSQNKRSADELQNQVLKKQKIEEYDSLASRSQEELVDSVSKRKLYIPAPIIPKREQSVMSLLSNYPIRFVNVSIENTIPHPEGDISFLNWLYTIKNHNENNINLSQAIMHFEKMLCLYRSLEKKQGTFLSSEFQLNALNALTAFAHKFLEQVCQFQSLYKYDTHNLIALIQNEELKEMSDSVAINLLFDASNWTRYFHSHQKTQRFRDNIPLLVEEFINLSEGTPSFNFHSLVKDIFDSAVRCGAELLKYPTDYFPNQELIVNSLEVVTNSYFSYRNCESVASIKEKTEIFVNIINNHISRIENIIKNNCRNNCNTDLAICLKQTKSALTMLKASLNEWNTATDHMEFALWTTWSLLQIHESIENGLRSVLYKNNNPSFVRGCVKGHHLDEMAKTAGLSMNFDLIRDVNNLGFKIRYPIQSLADGKGADIANDTESLCLNPEQEVFNPSEQKNTSIIIAEKFLNLLDRCLPYFNRITCKLEQRPN
ncbi:MAG: hypothetical protein V4494_02895 [Chlamydiota bacterium]